MKILIIMMIIIFLAPIHILHAQEESTSTIYTEDSKKSEDIFFIGSTFFMLGNLSSVNRPDFVQLNLGCRLNSKHTLAVELKTWKYAWPIGIPIGDSFESPEEKYDNNGYVREFGITFVYQYFWYKKAFVSIDAMSGLQRYNENGKFLQYGYVLFMTYRIGYQFTFFEDLFFIEPSIAFTYWPINTNTPFSFAQKESKWPNYRLFEPGLHFGFNFKI